MPSIFFQKLLPFDELAALSQEFPHDDFLMDCEELSSWSQVEVLYGTVITKEQLRVASRLRWIHCPTTEMIGLPLKEIQKRGNIIITLSKGENVRQIGEFVIGSILAFAKQFFHWPQVPHDPAEFWNWPLKETIWTMQKKILLQVGLGKVGTEIVKMANSFGMKTWGVRRQQSFHPYCKKTFRLANLNSLLPVVDVVVVALPKLAQISQTFSKKNTAVTVEMASWYGEDNAQATQTRQIKELDQLSEYASFPRKCEKSGLVTDEIVFGLEEFNLMRRDSIFIVIGSGNHVDENALATVAKSGKFRGVLIDAYKHLPPSKNSPLWESPNTILTPSISMLPLSEGHIAFSLFRKNLRLFTSGKINEMKNQLY